MASRGRFWTRSYGLPPDVFERWRDSLLELPGRPPRILAWASMPDGFCIGTPAALSYGRDSFSHVGWHEIEHGGWSAETRRLSWVCYPRDGRPGRRGVLELSAPGRVPELFRERVAATIVVERFVALSLAAGGQAGVTLSGRRDLGGSATAISWHATLSRGVSWQGPGVAEAAEAALQRLRAEYDPA